MTLSRSPPKMEFPALATVRIPSLNFSDLAELAASTSTRWTSTTGRSSPRELDAKSHCLTGLAAVPVSSLFGRPAEKPNERPSQRPLTTLGLGPLLLACCRCVLSPPSRVVVALGTMGLTFSRLWERMVSKQLEEEDARRGAARAPKGESFHAALAAARSPCRRRSFACDGDEKNGRLPRGRSCRGSIGSPWRSLLPLTLLVWQEGDADLDGRSRCCR
jgi:hypothetical protein